MGGFSALIGIFALFCAATDQDWFMRSRKAQFFVNIFGRNGARVFYGILGVFFIVLGLCSIAGVIDLSKSGRGERRYKPDQTIEIEFTGKR